MPDLFPTLDSRGNHTFACGPPAIDGGFAPQPGAGNPSPKTPALLAAWPKAARLTTAFLLGVALSALILHAFGYFRWSSKPTDLDRTAAPPYRVDLNHADRAELLQIPGVGENMAKRIEDHRTSHGPYKKVDDLRVVKGVGPATLERLRNWTEVDGAEPDEEMDDVGVFATHPNGAAKKTPGASPKKAATRKKTPPSTPIDVNRASAEELQKLPDIGPAFAQRIIEEREKKPFEKIEDLCRVAGIKERRLESLRPYVIVSKSTAKEP
jgi:competence protein ComEA